MNAPAETHKRNRLLLIIGALALFILLIWFLYWLLFGRFSVFTDDSYVHGNQVMLNSQVQSGVKNIYADDTDFVIQGQLLLSLDTANFEIRVEQLKSNLASKVREISALFYDAAAKEAAVVLKTAQLRQSELDVNHRKPLVETGAVSQEEFESYETRLKVASASVDLAQKEHQGAQALIAGTTVETHPKVMDAVATLRAAFLDLIRCSLWSPVTGFVAKRSVQVGDLVKAGETLMVVVPLDEIWIEANYKETSLRKIRIGQPVTFTADIYGGSLKYHGKVVGFQPGSGNAFALLPPENASGNWIKIIQRVPVRISVDVEEIRKNPLFLGLSLRTTVHADDQSGSKLGESAVCRTVYSTEIFDRQVRALAGYDVMIREIIEKNK